MTGVYSYYSYGAQSVNRDDNSKGRLALLLLALAAIPIWLWSALPGSSRVLALLGDPVGMMPHAACEAREMRPPARRTSGPAAALSLRPCSAPGPQARQLPIAAVSTKAPSRTTAAALGPKF